MVKPRLNQRILASFRRKKAKLGQFLKGEDNTRLCLVEELCYKFLVWFVARTSIENNFRSLLELRS